MKSSPRKASTRKPAEVKFLIPTGVYTETEARPAPSRGRGLLALLCLVPIFGSIRLIAPPAPPAPRLVTVVAQPPAGLQQATLPPTWSTPQPASEPAPASVAPSAPETNYVTGKRVPMRDAARAGSPILDRLASGQAVSVLVRQGEWVKVQHGLTLREGWVQAKRLTDAPPATEEAKPTVGPKLSTAAITKLLIAASLASYLSSCACPYNTDRGGRSCGRRSAYSRPGGYAPLCYTSDITPEMVAEYQASH